MQAEARTVERRPTPIAARVMAVVVVLVLAWHFLATYTWNASPNAIRQAIGNSTLTSYMIPMFGQSWSVFAPNPGSVNPSLDVRAIVERDGKSQTTDWYSLTDRSARNDVQLHPIPSRMYLNDFILANRYYASALAIPTDVRNEAGKTYGGPVWPSLLQRNMLTELKVDSSPTVSAFVDYERTVLGLASEVAVARWGSHVKQVQVRVLKTPVVPFAQRNQKVTPEVSYFVDGWRPVTRVPGVDTAVFDSMFKTGNRS
ncbi:MAG TPA: DUF5819 family protein [Lacisediminihabitans sp.]|uniref:DUF5819 family protein n=1 Tax=Lacisediminihabitans sp. TaxID=2787631 RepID=UPI002ED87051